MRIKKLYYNENYFSLQHVPHIITIAIGVGLGVTSTVVVILDMVAPTN